MSYNLEPLVVPTVMSVAVWAFGLAGGIELTKRLPRYVGGVALLLLLLAMFAGAVWFGFLVIAVAAAISPALAVGFVLAVMFTARVLGRTPRKA